MSLLFKQKNYKGNLVRVAFFAFLDFFVKVYTLKFILSIKRKGFFCEIKEFSKHEAFSDYKKSTFSKF